MFKFKINFPMLFVFIDADDQAAIGNKLTFFCCKYVV